MFRAIVLALAAKRLTQLFMDDEITEPIRELASRSDKLDYLFSCVRCMSVWAGLAAVVLPVPVVTALALSETVIALDALEDVI